MNIEVGDVVSRTVSGGEYGKGYTFKVQKTTERDGTVYQFAVDKNGSYHRVDLLEKVETVSSAWTPRPGDLLRVANTEDKPHYAERKLLCIEHNRFICQVHQDGDSMHQYVGYKYAKPVPPDTTITFADGVKKILSEIEYDALRESL